jgi:hypothetical protein
MWINMENKDDDDDDEWHILRFGKPWHIYPKGR